MATIQIIFKEENHELQLLRNIQNVQRKNHNLNLFQLMHLTSVIMAVSERLSVSEGEEQICGAGLSLSDEDEHFLKDSVDTGIHHLH